MLFRKVVARGVISSNHLCEYAKHTGNATGATIRASSIKHPPDRRKCLTVGEVVSWRVSRVLAVPLPGIIPPILATLKKPPPVLPPGNGGSVYHTTLKV